MDDAIGEDDLMDEVFDMGDAEENLDYDLGDDDQADEVRAYERYIIDPPDDMVIHDRENEDEGRLGICREIGQEWSRRTQRTEHYVEDDRPAELTAIDVVEELGD